MKPISLKVLLLILTIGGFMPEQVQSCAGLKNNFNNDVTPSAFEKDTTYLICPYYDHYINLLVSQDLPEDGIWEPALQDSFGTIYNSCVDGTSMYIYPNPYPVMDTARFELLWDPCAWELENVCYSSDSIYFTIPAFPGSHPSSNYFFNWYFPGQLFSLDSAYHLRVPDGGNHGYDLHIFFNEAPFCWWTFGELLAWDFYGAMAEQPCTDTLCPTGRDTTITICPFKGYPPDLLALTHQPLGGVWDPPLHETQWGGYYNSCEDSTSYYIHTTSTPGCPDVQDTTHFKLRWHPPCGWEYDACYTSDEYNVIIPPYTEFNGTEYQIDLYLGAGNPGVFEWRYCGAWLFDPDSVNRITCVPDWNNNGYVSHCVDVRMNDRTSGCDWYFPPFDYGYEYWDCSPTPCEIVHTDHEPQAVPISLFPVPARETLYFKTTHSITDVIISSAEGRVIKEIHQPGLNEIDIAELIPGWYLVSMTDGMHWYYGQVVK